MPSAMMKSRGSNSGPSLMPRYDALTPALGLELADLHLTPLDGAARLLAVTAPLKRKRTAQELRIFEDRGLAAVQLDRDDGTFRRDDVRVPPAGRFRIGRLDLGEI